MDFRGAEPAVASFPAASTIRDKNDSNPKRISLRRGLPKGTAIETRYIVSTAIFIGELVDERRRHLRDSDGIKSDKF